MIGRTISHYPALWDFPLPGIPSFGGIPRYGTAQRRDSRKRNKILEHLPTTFMRSGTSSGQVGGGGMGMVYKAQDTKLNRLNCFEASPKGMDIPTEGNALGSDLPTIITTLKGLNTRGAYATITC